MDTLARVRLLTADDNFWEQQNPVLLKGEVGFRNVESDDPLMRVGDGIRNWNDLPDMNKVGPIGPQGEIGPIGPIGPEGPRGPPGQENDPWTAPFRVQPPGGGAMIMQLNANRNIDFTGCMTITPSGCDVALDILPGANYALRAQGRVTVGPEFETLGPDGPRIKVYPDGSGFIGPHRTSGGPVVTNALAWNTSGKFSFYNPAWSTWQTSYAIDSLVEFWGDNGVAGFRCDMRGGAVNKYAAYIVNETPAGAGAGACNGLRIESGWVRQDMSFRVTSTMEVSGPGTNTHQTLFAVAGDGLVIARLPQSGMSSQVTWNATDSGIYRVSSARRYKANIRNVAREKARELVRQLRPITFTSLLPDDDPARPIYGLIAEEVAALDPALASYDAEGRPDSVQYDRVLLALLPALREALGLDEPEEVAA